MRFSGTLRTLAHVVKPASENFTTRKKIDENALKNFALLLLFPVIYFDNHYSQVDSAISINRVIALSIRKRNILVANGTSLTCVSVCFV